MGLKQMAAVHGDWPIVAKSNECTQQHSWKAQAVLARVPKTTVLTEGEVGVVVHIHLLKQTTKALQTHCSQLRKKMVNLEPKRAAIRKSKYGTILLGLCP
jgi:hypothetical protein